MSQKKHKRDRQSLKQEDAEHRVEADRRIARRRRLFRRLGLWIGTLAGLCIIVFVLVIATDPESSGDGWLVDTPNAGEWSQGSPNAPVHLVVYSDFQCPLCANHHGYMKELMGEFSNDIRFTFRHFPLRMHSNAELAAMATEAAGMQGKFWEMQDLIFRRQSKWSGRGRKAAEQVFVDYAGELDLNVRRYDHDMSTPDILLKIEDDYTNGKNSGVLGTPTYFLNGRKVLKTPRTYEDLRSLVLKAKRQLP